MNGHEDAVPPRQLPLALGHEVAYARDDLVASPANASALSLLDRWPDWPSPVVVLAGPPGSGKTHIARAWQVEAHATALDPARLEAATGLRGPFLVDAVDAHGVDEPGLFHLVNLVRTEGTHMLLTARRAPGQWGVRLPDLMSRLKAATLTEIEEPDDTLLAGVIAKLFADRQVTVEAHVVQYLVRRIERSLSTAIRVVERLDRKALEEKVRITRALAAEAVRDEDMGQARLDL